MKKLKCTLALLIAGTLAATAVGCAGSSDMSWSYKDDQTTMSIGSYIYYNYSAFQKAAQKVSDSNGDFLSEEIENDDGDKVTARDYIAEQTDLACKNYLNVEKTFKDLGLSLTDEEQTNAETSVSSMWSYMGSTYQGYGISQDSLTKAYGILSAKYEKIFKTMYGEGGEKAVSADDLNKYFTENYTDYSYFTVPLYDTSTDSTSSTASTSSGTTTTAKSAEDIAKIKADLDSYAAAINDDGKAFTDEVAVYQKAYSIETDPSTSNCAIMANSGLGDAVIAAYDKLAEGKAEVLKVGDDDASASYYLLYKAPIKEKAATLSTDSDLNYSTLISMKSQEYMDYMDEQAKTVECEKNQAAIDKYGPDKFITYSSSTAGDTTVSSAASSSAADSSAADSSAADSSAS